MLVDGASCGVDGASCGVDGVSCGVDGASCGVDGAGGECGAFMCHCGNTGMEWTPNKSQHTKFTQEKKILPPLPPDLNSQPFDQRVQRSYQQAIPAQQLAPSS